MKVLDLLKYFPYEHNLETYPCIQYYGHLTVKSFEHIGSELLIKVIEKPMIYNERYN